MIQSTGELLLFVRLNDHIGRGVRDASEDPTVFDLVIVQVAAVGLVHASLDDLSGAGGAGSGAARVGDFDSLLLGLVEDVRVVFAVERDLSCRSLFSYCYF